MIFLKKRLNNKNKQLKWEDKKLFLEKDDVNVYKKD